MLAVSNISSLLETLLQKLNGREDSEEVLVGIVRGACMLLATVQMISKLVKYELAAWACIVAVFP